MWLDGLEARAFQAEINIDGTADDGSCCGDDTFSVSKFILFILLLRGVEVLSDEIAIFRNPEFNPLYKATKSVN